MATIINLVENTMYLFDMIMDEQTYIEHPNLSDTYILSVVPEYSYYHRCPYTNRMSVKADPQRVYLNTAIMVFDQDSKCYIPTHMSEWSTDKDFTEYLKQFNEDPQKLISEFHIASPYIY